MAKTTVENNVSVLDVERVESVNQISGLMRLLELERSFIIFSVIYFPVTWLFLNRGYLEEFLLGLYTLVMIILSLLMVGKFVLHFANAADKHTGKFGRLFAIYIFNGFLPLVMLKAFGHVLNMILPIDKHQGIVCDLVRLFRQFYYDIFHYQTALNYFILGSLAVMFFFAVWSVRQNDSD